MNEDPNNSSLDFAPGDPVWDLLSKAPRSEASPWFAGRVMHLLRCPNHTGNRDRFGGLMRWLAPTAVAIVLLVAGVAVEQSTVRTVSLMSVEFELIENLDLFVTSADQAIWLENSYETSSF